MIFFSIILAIILVGLGIFAIVDPEEVIYLASFRWFQNFEPTERYICRVRNTGILSIIIAIILVISAFAV